MTARIMTDGDLCYLSAVDAIAAFKARKLSPVELMQAVIARAEAVNPKINAFTYRFFEAPLAVAAFFGLTRMARTSEPASPDPARPAAAH